MALGVHVHAWCASSASLAVISEVDTVICYAVSRGVTVHGLVLGCRSSFRGRPEAVQASTTGLDATCAVVVSRHVKAEHRLRMLRYPPHSTML